MRRRLGSLALVIGLTAVAACSTTSTASRDALRALSVKATTTTEAPSPPTTAPNCTNPTASLRPQGPLPGPGALPGGSYMSVIQQRGRLIVGVDQNTLLFGYLNPASGQIEGFDIDMLRQVAKAIFGDDGKNQTTHLQFTAISSAQRIPFVQNGTVDIVADTMTINCARDTQVSFSSVYFNAGQRILVRDDSTIKSSADLGGKRTCAAAGSTSIANVEDVNKTHASAPAIPVAVTDWTDCLVALQSGTIDAVSTDDTILAGLKAQDPHTQIVGDKFTQEPYGMAMKLDHPEFVRFVNSVLERIRADGTWTAIWNRWLAPAPAPAPPTATYRD
ncbi:MAG: polar amino acid transport system substrate-binding protein [Acidimicrobiaceae bacterium]|jgi:polar amino acid transport system substrate-binding protein|nr:polar amino acid transport system substrate-binding protein [Acidimicrobiaceae bacterium]